MTSLYSTDQWKDYSRAIDDKDHARKILEDAQALFASCYEVFKRKSALYDKAQLEYNLERKRHESDDSSSVVQKIS